MILFSVVYCITLCVQKGDIYPDKIMYYTIHCLFEYIFFIYVHGTFKFGDEFLSSI